MAWTTLYTDRAAATVEPHLVAQWTAALRAKGYDDPARLYPFAFADLAEDLIKHRSLLAYQMGLGKTAAAIAAADTRGTRHVLIVLPKKLLGEWEAEFARLGLSDEVRVIESLADIDGYVCPSCEQPVTEYTRVLNPVGRLVDVRRECEACGVPARWVNRLARFNIVTMRQLWAVPKDSPHVGGERYAARDAGGVRPKLKHTFAWYLRRRSELTIIDEAYNLANADTLQTRAVNLLRPRKRLLLTGTPIKGYPENILPLLNWLLGTGSALFPDYDATQERSLARFTANFGTKIEKRREDGTKYLKRVPRIKHANRFQAMLAPFMRRRVSFEPAVAAYVKMPRFVIVPEQVDPDKGFAALYRNRVERFVEWFAEAQAQERLMGKPMAQANLLTKLNSLSAMGACPQAFVRGQAATSKQKRILDLIHTSIREGRKVLFFSEHLDSIEWYRNHADLARYEPVVITGAVSMTRRKRSGTSAREDRLDAFREGTSQLLIASTPAFAEGLNVPQAGTVIFDSFPWVPSIQSQAWSRVLRAAQKADPVHIYLVGMAGTIDDYLSAVCAIKRAAFAEGIDYEQTEMDYEDLPDARVYAEHLVAVTGAVTAAYDATRQIERLKAQAAASGTWASAA